MPNRYSIVGTQFTGIPEAFMAALEVGATATLVREPTNKFDPNAVAVWIGGKRVGYIPKAQNKVLAKFIDDAPEPQASLAMDGAPGKSITGTFVRSPNSGFPQVEV